MRPRQTSDSNVICLQNAVERETAADLEDLFTERGRPKKEIRDWLGWGDDGGTK